MRKTDKKLDNAIRASLTEACDVAQEKSEGFMWLTHLVNYDFFPNSLSVICVYDTDTNLANADVNSMRALIKKHLASIDINLKDINRNIRFDTEERCQEQNQGRWAERLGS